MPKKFHELRNSTGKYDMKLDRMCKCGHTLGEHGDPDVPAAKRACVADSGCDCTGFKHSKKLKEEKIGPDGFEKHQHVLVDPYNISKTIRRKMLANRSQSISGKIIAHRAGFYHLESPEGYRFRVRREDIKP